MEEALRLLIAAALPGIACDWGMSRQGASEPRVVLTMVSGGQAYTASDAVNLRPYRVQVDCYGATYLAVRNMARSLIAALGGHRGGAFGGIFLDAERDFAPDTESGETMFRRSLDFMIHHKEV